MFFFFFFILADVFSITFPKNPKLFILRSKKSLIGYYCTLFIYLFLKRAIIFFLPASCIYWNRPVLRSSTVCSVFVAWFLSAEKQVGNVRSDTKFSTLPFLARYCHRSSWRRTKQFKCSWPQKTFFFFKKKEEKKRRQNNYILLLSNFWRKTPQHNRNFLQLSACSI